jgi:hypothetical protein
MKTILNGIAPILLRYHAGIRCRAEADDIARRATPSAGNQLYR